MEDQPRLRLLAGRCFEHAGDVQEALQLVMSSSGIQRSRCDFGAIFNLCLLFYVLLRMVIRPSIFFLWSYVPQFFFYQGFGYAACWGCCGSRARPR
jgi:hypothetical protein